MDSATTSRSPISLWDQSAEEADHRQSFAGTEKVDVAIVGGGFTGLSTALHCGEKNLSTHVVEARHIGYGGSGRNCGLVNAALWLPPQDVRRQLGDTYGPRFIHQFGKGPEYVFSLIEKHQMRCEVTRTGTIHAAHSPAGFKELEGRAAEWHRLGEPVDLLDRATTVQMTGTDRFYGGLLDHRAGTINPMSYCRGLARAARNVGARISTGVTATSIKRDNRQWIVETNQGAITADKVILGTNAYTDSLWPGLNKVFTTIHYFQLATTPLDDSAAHILPGRQGVWDTGQIMFNIRRDAHDRLLIGSMGRIHGSVDTGLSKRWAQRQLKRTFPTLKPAKFEEAWYGQIAMTPDHLPRIYELEDGLYTSIGYNGRGITTGTMFGKAMADLLTGMDKADLPLPVSEPSPAPRAKLMSGLYQTAFAANQLVQSI